MFPIIPTTQIERTVPLCRNDRKSLKLIVWEKSLNNISC